MADDQRPAHGSALGHGVGLGGNGLLWALGTYGWGVAAVIGSLFGVFALTSITRRRRANKRAGGSDGGRSNGSGRGGGLRGLFGRGRSGESTKGGRGGGRKGGGGPLGRLGRKAGGGSEKGGFLRRMTQRRSTSPGGRGGLPGRGGGRPPGKKGPLGRGPGKGRTPGGGPGRNRNKNKPGGNSRNKNKPGSRQRSRNKTPGGGRLRSLLGGGRNKNRNPSKNHPHSKNRPPKKKSTGKQRRKLFGTSINPGVLPFMKPKNNPKGKNQVTTPTTPPKPTPAPRRPRKAPSPRAAAAPATGGGRGAFTAAAEGFASVLAKPADPIGTLKGMDRALEDLHGSFGVVADGVRQLGHQFEEEMPDEAALHEELAQYSKQIGQLAQNLEALRAEQHRRNASDHERIDNHRTKEENYDFNTNKE